MKNPHSRLLKLTLLLIASLTVLSGATIATSLPGIASHFAHEEGAQMLSRLILTAPALTIALIAPFAGLLIHRFGRLRPVYAGLVVYAIAGTSGLIAETLMGLIWGRIGLGIATAVMMTAGTVLVGDYFSHEARQKFLGLQGAFIALGGVMFMTAGGFLSDIHWRAPFAVYAASLLLIPLVFWKLYEPRHAGTEPEAPALEAANAKLWPVFTTAFLTMVVFYIVPTQFPFVVIDYMGGTGKEAGFAMSMVPLFAAIGSVSYHRVRKRLSVGQIYTVVFLMLGVGLGVVGLAEALWQTFAPLILAGFGLGLSLANTQVWFLERAPAAKRAKLAGFFTASLFLGQFCSPLLVQPFLSFLELHYVFSLFGATLLAAGFALLIGLRIRRAV